MVYRITNTQMRDITDILNGLNSFDNPDDDSRDIPGIDWSEGHRAILGVGSIPIKTDTTDIEEILGRVVREDFGWVFTQEIPE